MVEKGQQEDVRGEIWKRFYMIYNTYVVGKRSEGKKREREGGREERRDRVQ